MLVGKVWAKVEIRHYDIRHFVIRVIRRRLAWHFKQTPQTPFLEKMGGKQEV